ncbi:nucleotide exchange factor GrpE [Christiangramia forsetii]|uniref:Protein GrpE n=2 Tax=Christiangramia forsetii TaxID=411153 RepID=A0LYP2_CHRFK|nr:nucleotide exchange factor GrpE [Christiangramia forsetii]GGG33714.1 protein GrpE [Christiangramia forsetii]CAL65487.1 molecular chaperone GrpE [Christiangramia forsetii KT0803]
MSRKEDKSKDDHKEVKDQVEEAMDKAIDEVDGNDENDDEQPEVNVDELTEEERLMEDVQKEKDKFLRLFAEFENYKRRTSKERLELFKTANQEVMSAMLPILDDFDRAMNELRKSGDENLLVGIELIHNKLKETLKAKGLERIEVEQGSDFDSEIHEAITQIPAPSDKLKGKIVDVVEPGYKLGERIIRYPKVVTGK